MIRGLLCTLLLLGVVVYLRASTCQNEKAVISVTYIGCPPAKGGAGECIRYSWYDAITGLAFGYLCGYYPDYRCYSAGGNRFFNEKREDMLCNLYGDQCGIVWRTTWTYNLGPVQQKVHSICSLL